MAKRIDVSQWGDQIIDLYVMKGMSFHDMVTKLGLTATPVGRWMRENDIKLRPIGSNGNKQRHCEACGCKFWTTKYSAHVCAECCPSRFDVERWVRHRITRTQFEAMYASQAGKCAICTSDIHMLRPRGNEGTQIRDAFTAHVDHDHATGRIRGLLCSNCNIGLGMFGDNFIVLQRAIEYLHSAASSISSNSAQ